MKRRLPKPADLAPLLRFKKPVLNPVQRRLANALTIEDLRRVAPGARRRVPPSTTPTVRPGTSCPCPRPAGVPRRRAAADILRDVSKVDLGRDVLGKPQRAAVRHRADRVHPADAHRGRDRRRHRCRRRRHPVHALDDGHDLDRGRAKRPTPTAATGSSSTCGRTATGRWDSSNGRPPRATRPSSSPSTCRSPGLGLRDVRNGMTIPPTLTPRTVRQRDPATCLVVQPVHHRAADLRLAGLVGRHRRRPARRHVRPHRDYDDLRWLREQWTGKLVVKGVQSVDDARRVADCGVDGLTLVQPRRPPARPRTRSRSTSCRTWSSALERWPRGLPRHRHHVRRRRRRSDRARRPLHLGRPGLPLRPDGRRPHAESTGRSRSSPPR